MAAWVRAPPLSPICQDFSTIYYENFCQNLDKNKKLYYNMYRKPLKWLFKFLSSFRLESIPSSLERSFNSLHIQFFQTQESSSIDNGSKERSLSPRLAFFGSPFDYSLNEQRVTVLWLGSSVGQNTSLSHWRSWVRVPSKSPIKAPFTVLAEESAKYVIKLMTSKATYK